MATDRQTPCLYYVCAGLLVIYQFFTIGKGIIEDKIKRGRY